MRKITVTIMAILGMTVFVSDVRAEIASKAYVDETKEQIMMGDNDWVAAAEAQGYDVDGTRQTVEAVGVVGTLMEVGAVFQEVQNSVSDLQDTVGDENSGLVADVSDLQDDVSDLQDGVVNGLSGAVNLDQGDNRANGALLTNSNGSVVVENGAYVTNAKITSDANIELGKLHFPTPPATCSTRGCMLMFYNGQYIWEPVTRDTQETVATTGAVTATAVATSSNTDSAVGALCPPGYGWNGDRCDLPS